MTTLSATKARANLFSLLRRATRGHETLRIHYRDRSVVLLPEEEFESLVETAALLGTPGLRESLKLSEADRRARRVYSVEQVFAPTRSTSRKRPRARGK